MTKLASWIPAYALPVTEVVTSSGPRSMMMVFSPSTAWSRTSYKS